MNGKRIYARVKDEKLLSDFQTMVTMKYGDNRYGKGKELTTALKLYLTINGHPEYKDDVESWSLLDDFLGAHTHDGEVHMIKAIDDTPVKLSNKKEKAFAVCRLLKNEHSETFSMEDIKKASGDMVGASGNRAVKGYVDVMVRYNKIKIVDTRNKIYAFCEVNEHFLDVYEVDERVKNKFKREAIKEAR